MNTIPDANYVLLYLASRLTPISMRISKHRIISNARHVLRSSCPKRIYTSMRKRSILNAVFAATLVATLQTKHCIAMKRESTMCAVFTSPAPAIAERLLGRRAIWMYIWVYTTHKLFIGSAV